MENKKLTANVITNETVFNHSAEQAVDIEFTLPDFLPDINRILKCKAVSMISSKGVNGASLNIDGCVTVTVIYSNDENKIFAYEYQYPFNKNIDIKNSFDNLTVNCETNCEYINCRAVTKRKVDIHGAVEIKIKCYNKKSVEILSDFDDNDLELLRCEIPATTPMGHNEKYLIFEEEIEVGQGQPDILSLIKYDCNPILKESRLINGKVIVKGELQFSALYSCEKGILHTLKNALPFSQILEIDGVNDECECDTQLILAYLELKPNSNSNGGSDKLMLNAKLLIVSDAYCQNNIEIITDAFSKKHNCEIVKNNILVNKLKKSVVEDFSCKKKLDIESGTISSITDLWSEIQSVKCSFSDEYLILTGVIIVGMLATNEDSLPIYYEKTFDYEYKTSIEKYGDNLWCEPRLKIVSNNYTLSADGIELRLEMSVNAPIYSLENTAFVSEVNIDDKNIIKSLDLGAMVIYFAKTDETVWEIAKSYCAGVDEIKKLNNLNDDILMTDRALLIPI